jgi:archaellum biogenesis ATPase FlaH
LILDNVVLANLLQNEYYVRSVFPHLKAEYFATTATQTLFRMISDYVNGYNAVPSKEAMFLVLDGMKAKESVHNEVKELLTNLERDHNTNDEWLKDKTEEWCKKRAISNALDLAIDIQEGTSKEFDDGAIPGILADALSVSFDQRIGHDFLEDHEARYDFYHRKEEKIRFDLDCFNKITNGGLSKKSFNVILAGTGGGKSRLMTHMATANLRDAKNVLYITLEMSEERIAERIDTNLLDISIKDLKELPKETYESRIKAAKKNFLGKIIIKEYPTASVGANHFRHLLRELKIKKNFVPDIIYVDYINLCVSSRLKAAKVSDTYSYIKAIAEELRGLCVEFNVPLVTATQVNRTGFTSSDVGLEDTSESFGLPATADFMFALINSEELDSLNQIMVKQLKNRYGDPAYYRRFVIGVEKHKFKHYDCEAAASDELVDLTPTKKAAPRKQQPDDDDGEAFSDWKF